MFSLNRLFVRKSGDFTFPTFEVFVRNVVASSFCQIIVFLLQAIKKTAGYFVTVV